MTARSQQPWYAAPDPTGTGNPGEIGLRFSCTQCGNCCTGAPGYVHYTNEEADAMASELGITRAQFDADYTHNTPYGLSLVERKTEFGHDCVFLDRETQPGKALCRVYRSRPAQCRTWPFWKDNLRSRNHWASAARTCPGINIGTLHSVETIELTVERDTGAARED